MPFDRNHLNPSGRTPLEPHPAQTAAQKSLSIERRREIVEELNTLGYSARKIAQHLGVNHQTVNTDLAVIQAQRLVEQSDNLTDRLSTAVARFERHYQIQTEIALNTKAPAMARTNASQVAKALQEKIMEMQGTTAPEKITVVVYNELYNAFMDVLSTALPEQRAVVGRLLMKRLAGSPLAAQLLGTVGNAFDDIVEADSADDPVTDINADSVNSTEVEGDGRSNSSTGVRPYDSWGFAR